MATFPGTCALSHPHHASIPSPVCAETCIRVDFVRVGDATYDIETQVRRQFNLVEQYQLSRCKHVRVLERVVLLSVTEWRTTLARPPRSSSAGHARLPTFSIMTTECASGLSSSLARFSISASRVQPEPMLIWMARAPMSRMVCQASIVLPEPGELTISSARISRPASQPRFRSARS